MKEYTSGWSFSIFQNSNQHIKKRALLVTLFNTMWARTVLSGKMGEKADYKNSQDTQKTDITRRNITSLYCHG